MRITDLNDDILSLLSALVAPNDVGSWRLVCRTLGQAAHPYRFRHLILRDQNQLRDVCESVAKTPTCARHMLYLTMGENCLGSGVVGHDSRDTLTQRIVNLIHAAPNLVFLMMDTAEDWLTENPTLVAAVAMCLRLETLVLEQWSSDYDGLSYGTVGVFEALRAPLRTLKLSSYNPYDLPVHVFTLLQPLTLTLESLDCSMEIALWSEQGPAPVFPHVTTLHLRHVYIHVQTLEAAFPALRELALEFDASSILLDAHVLEAQIHAVNVTHALSNWQHLTILSGFICGLWTLALWDVEADLLVIYDFACDKEEMEQRQAVLRAVRAQMLNICICAHIEGETLLVRDLPEHAQGMRILDLDVSLERRPASPVYDAQGVLTFLLDLPDLLESFSELLYLRVVVDPSESSSKFLITDSSADERATIAQKLFQQIDSLSLFTLCWAGAGWTSTTYRRTHASISVGGGSDALCVADERLDESIGRLLIEDLHKMWSRLGDRFYETLRSLASDPKGGDIFSGMLLSDDN